MCPHSEGLDPRRLHGDRQPMPAPDRNIYSPKIESGAFFGGIVKSVVRRGHATDDARPMIEHRLYNMRLNAQPRHARRGGAP